MRRVLSSNTPAQNTLLGLLPTTTRRLRSCAGATALAVVASGAAAIAPSPASAETASSWALAGTVIPAAAVSTVDPEDGEFESIPLPELSTETSTTKMLPSGEHEIDIATVPINYFDEDDNWVPINTELVEPTEDSDSPQAPATDYAAENAAASYVASIPADAGDTAARFAVDAAQLPGGEAWVTIKLAGLEGQPVIDGDTATFTEFSDAATSDLDGVDAVQLQATGDGLKETIVLEAAPTAPGQPGDAQQADPDAEAPGDDPGSDAPGTADPARDSYGYDYELQVAPGVTPRLLPDGSIDFTRDAAPNQSPVFSIPLGNMVDSADTTTVDGVETEGPAYTNAVDYELVENKDAANRWSLRVLPDVEWLTDPARVYPVMIDPTITRGPAIDCTLMEDVPNSNRCGNAQTFVEVGHLAGGEDRRGIFRFDIGGIDPAATIDRANLELWLNVNQTTQGNGAPYVVRRAGKAFNSGVSWNSTGNNGPWVNGGGDPSGINMGENFLYGTAEDSGWRYFGVKEAVEGWHTGNFVNDGLVLKQKNENVTNRLSFVSSSTANPASRHPNLNITYTPAVGPQAGDRGYWQFEERELTDRMTARVNVGNGNLLVQAQDASVAGVAGWDMSLMRYYNSTHSQSAANSNMGAGWSHGFGGAVRLEFPKGADDRSRIRFWGPSGYRVLFDWRAAQSNDYKREEPGINASLTRQPNENRYRLEFFSGSVYLFDLQGQLQSMRDKNGNALAFSYRSQDNQLGSVTDTRGRVARFSYNSGNLVSQVSIHRPDGANNTPGAEMMRWIYTYTQPQGQLAQMRSARLAVYDPAAVGQSTADTTAIDTSVGSGGNLGALTEYDYSADGRLLEIRDARETAARDGASGTEPGEGGTTRFAYDGITNRVTEVRRLSQKPGTAPSVTTLNYFPTPARDSSDTCTNDDRAATFRTTVNGERTDVDDVTRYCVDQHGRILRTTDANGNKRSTSWTINSNVSQAQMPGTGSGQSTYQYSYEGEDENPTGAESPEGATSGATYAESGSAHNPASISGDDTGGDEEKPMWRYEYDDNDNLTHVRSRDDGQNSLNITYRYCWTPEGQVRRILPGTGGDCDGGVQGDDTILAYNPKKELGSVNRPAGGDQAFTYDNLSRLETVTDGKGVRTRYCYDAFDRVVRVDHYDPADVDGEPNCGDGPPPESQTASWDYDLAGNLVSLGNISTTDKEFEFDELNRVESEEPQQPSGRTEYTYDPAGNVRSVEVIGETDAGLEPTTYTYDKLNRVVSLDDQRPGALTTTFEYDNRDNRVRTVFPITDANGQSTGNPLVQRMVYDDDSQVRCLYSFRQTGGPSSTGCDAVRGHPRLITFREYDYRNPDLTDDPSTDKDETRTSTKYRMIELGNKQTRYAYDSIKRLSRATTRIGTATTGTPLSQFEYRYSQRSNLTEENAIGSTPGLRTGRLQMAYSQGDEICASIRQASSANLTCTNATPGQTTYSHDDNGSLETVQGGSDPGSLAGLTLGYNMPRQTTSITPPGAGSSPTSGDQSYDGVEQDRRTEAGATTMSYGYAGQVSAQQTSGQSAQLFVRDPAGDLIAMLSRDQTDPDAIRAVDYYLVDDQRSVITTYDGFGNQTGDGVIRYLYEPYGELIRSWTQEKAGVPQPGPTPDSPTVNPGDDSLNANAAAPSSDTNPFTYVSGYHDRATGLIKFGTRYYMPSLATWTQPDPKNGSLTNPQSINQFQYGYANPCSNTDESGRSVDYEALAVACAEGALESLIFLPILGGNPATAAAIGCIEGAGVELIAQLGAPVLADILSGYMEAETAYEVAEAAAYYARYA